MWFLLVPFVLKEPCSRPGDPDIALQSNVPRCLLSPTSNEMPNSQLCPDISGYATSGIIWRSAWKNSGALWTEDTGNSLTKSYDYGPDPIVRVRMRAGAYDSTYGSSSSVSVAAAYVLMIIKE
nr:MAG TPA: hypothetical protein [Caudoviricetes sp.]